MYGFEIKRTMKKDQLPSSRGGKRRDYSKLLKSVATLEKDEVLELEVEKYHVVSGIRDAVKKHFRHNKIRVTSRTDKQSGTINCYIIREN